jgi:hypothetical protein
MISKLKSIDLSKVKRLSVKNIKLPAQEVRTEEPEMTYEQLALKRRLEMCIARNDTGFFGVFGSGGTGKTTAQMKDFDTFDTSGWDIGIGLNYRHDGYPFPALEDDVDITIKAVTLPLGISVLFEPLD